MVSTPSGFMHKLYSTKMKMQYYIIILLILLCSCRESKQHIIYDEAKFFRLVSLKEYEGEMYNPKDYFDSVDTLGNNEKKCSRDIVTQERTAIRIVKSLYSYKFRQEEKIHDVQASMLGDSLWKVCAIGRDSMVIYIYKSNGRIMVKKSDSLNAIPIKEPSLAAQIGIAYLCDIYGDEVINGEYPFEVVKFKHSWLIMGTLPEDYCGGTGSITISSKGGMVRYFCHEK